MDSSKTHKRKAFLINLLFWVAVLAIVYLVIKNLSLIGPIVVALILASIARPLTKWLSKETKTIKVDGEKREVPRKFHLPKQFAAVLAVVVLFIVLAGLSALIILIVASKVGELTEAAKNYYETSFTQDFQNFSDKIEALIARIKNLDNSAIAGMVDEMGNSLLSSVGSLITSVSAKLVSWAGSIAKNAPSALLKTIICLIATVFLSIDFDRMKTFIKRILPEKAYNTVHTVKETFLDMIWGFLRSYALIFVITVIEILVGLLIIGVKKPFLIAVLIGIFDAFPIVGSGMILLPWAVITLISGQIWKGVGLLILWALVVVIREIIEPKIIGEQVGLRPIVTLICMYAGTRLFGGIGLFMLPIAASIIVDLNRRGYLKLYQDEPEPEEMPGSGKLPDKTPVATVTLNPEDGTATVEDED